jgi:hypothetical protein
MDTLTLECGRDTLERLKCRFGCDAPVLGIFHMPQGCICWTDPIQALCEHHADRAQSVGPIECIADFSAGARGTNE